MPLMWVSCCLHACAGWGVYALAVQHPHVPGGIGDSCSECTDDRVLSVDYTCEQCLDLGVLLAIMVAAAALCSAVLVFFVRDLRQGRQSEFSGLFKITVSFFQFGAVGLAFSFNWEAAFVELLAIQDAITTFGTAYFQLQCFFPGSSDPFLIETVTYAVTPLVCIGVVWLLLNALGHREVAKTVGVLIVYLFQPTLTRRFVLLLSCIQLGADGSDQLYLAQDLGTQCFSPHHLITLGLVGVPMLLLYVIGIPFGFYVLMRRHRHWIHTVSHAPTTKEPMPDKEAQASFLQNYSFLWDGYHVDKKGPQMYWEVVMVCRKSLLELIAVMFASNYHAQAIIGFVVVVSALAVHLAAYPFRDANLNHLELVSLFCTAVIFLCGQFTFVDLGYEDVTPVLASYVAFGFTALFGVVLLVVSVDTAIRQVKQRKLTPRLLELERRTARAGALASAAQSIGMVPLTAGGVSKSPKALECFGTEKTHFSRAQSEKHGDAGPSTTPRANPVFGRPLSVGFRTAPPAPGSNYYSTHLELGHGDAVREQRHHTNHKGPLGTKLDPRAKDPQSRTGRDTTQHDDRDEEQNDMSGVDTKIETHPNEQPQASITKTSAVSASAEASRERKEVDTLTQVHAAQSAKDTALLTWMRKLDTQSNRYYFINRATKTRSWQEPTDGWQDYSARDFANAATSTPWVRKLDAQRGRHYYVNVQTKASTWVQPKDGWTERPSERKAAAVAVRASPWIRKRDPKSDHYFYANTREKTTSWTEPAEGWREVVSKACVAVKGPQQLSPGVASAGPIAALTPSTASGKESSELRVVEVTQALASPKPTLPWLRKRAPRTGRHYYVHIKTKKTQWKVPAVR